MKVVLALFILGICTLTLFAQSNSNASLDARRAQLREAIQAEWEYTLRTHPEFATAIGDNRYNDRLDDYSQQAVEKELAHAKQQLKLFEAIDTKGFPEDEALNQQLMVRRLRIDIEGAPFNEWQMSETQFGGVHLELASMPRNMPFNTVKDYQNYLSRLGQIPQALDQVTANLKLGMNNKLMPPRFLLEKVAVQAQNVANATEEKGPFTEPLKMFPASISSAEQQRLRDEVLKVVKTEVNPAFAKFAEFVKTDYAPKGRMEMGVWSLPNGNAYYQYAVKLLTTTGYTPEQIHQMGLKQVAELDAQMLAIAKQQGYPDVKSFNEHIRQDPKLHGVSGQQILDLYQHYTDQMYTKLPQLFGVLPKTKLVVVPMEAFRAPDSVPADYSIGTPDGSRPGRINVNEYDPTHRLLLNVEAIAYHEGVPGHHLEFSISAALTGIPEFRKFNYLPAYSEGWALYSERLGKDVGFYQDPYSEYGRLGNEMWRSVRLVVDTGVHYKHWTREQMVQFFRQHTAMDEPNIQTEVDRYIAWPGQALSYKMGQMEILALREQAEKGLGAKYDIKTFHDELLSAGPLPLDVLHQRMTNWIAAQRAPAGTSSDEP
ncbi:MAG TPA: DUF885 domain-containing protein [Candidatus Binatia bacterium]|nr:DUF885 domain-containing protein [Candidatus Binatia bacterium]